MDTTYTPFCSEIPFLRALRKSFAWAGTLVGTLLLLLSAVCVSLALPPLYWIQFLALPGLLACPALLGLWAHAKGRNPLRGAGFGWLATLAAVLFLALLAGIAGVWLPLPVWHDLCTGFIAGLGLPAVAAPFAPAAFSALAMLTLLTLFVFCKTTVHSIKNGQANVKGATLLSVLLLLWAALIFVGGGTASVFYTPQGWLLPLPLPFNLFLALAAATLAAACILFAVALFRVAGTVKKYAKF